MTANAFASLNKLAPGRIDFGVGTGFTGRRAMGLGAVKLADMEEYVRVVRALLRGETVEAKIEGKTRLIRLLNPELGLINTERPDRALCRRDRPARAGVDRQARRRLDQHHRRCRGRHRRAAGDALISARRPDTAPMRSTRWC